MKIVLWIGNEPNQLALAHKVNRYYPIDTIFLETKKNKKKITVSLLFQKIIERIFLIKISKSWFGMLSYYKKMNDEFPSLNIVNVNNINSDNVYQKTKSINPDLILVSGTRLIKQKLLNVNPKIGILNLHTGLSPYIKGGPNCTNWCIASRQFHLIGNTIMWIDKGIDSGRIVASELTLFDGSENLLKIHIKVMEHAHSLYLKAIEKVINNEIIGVAQNDIDTGKIYYTKDWNLYQKIKFSLNLLEFKENVNSDDYIKKQSLLKTFNLK